MELADALGLQGIWAPHNYLSSILSVNTHPWIRSHTEILERVNNRKQQALSTVKLLIVFYIYLYLYLLSVLYLLIHTAFLGSLQFILRHKKQKKLFPSFLTWTIFWFCVLFSVNSCLIQSALADYPHFNRAKIFTNLKIAFTWLPGTVQSILRYSVFKNVI